MKIQRNKTLVIASVLMLTIAVSLVALPVANAQEAKNTFAICIVTPNLIGVGQEVLVVAGLTLASAWPQPGWDGVTVTVERPDGTTETLGPVTTDTTGMTGILYVPTMAGTYYFQTHFAGDVVEAERRPGVPAPEGTVLLASSSEKVALTVTQEPREYYPGFPAPPEYWTRPIDAQLREWSAVAGNWLNVVSYTRVAPYNDDAPETAHILWQKPLAEGGLVGGLVGGGLELETELDIIGYEHGDAYEGKWQNPVIINGILYYNRHSPQYMMPALNSTAVEQEVVAVDLHTGEELWSKVLGNNERLAFGQIMYWKTMNMYGAFAYLWTTVGSTWNAYDPLTGRWEYNITNVPRGTRRIGPMGEILIYTVDTANGWMTQWNSTSVVWKTYVDMYLPHPETYYWAGRWRPHGITFDGTKGIDWNETIPVGLPGTVQTVLEDRIIGGNTNWAGAAQQPNPVFWGISLKSGEEGKLLFNETWTLPVADLHVDIPGSQPVSLEDGVFVVAAKETLQYYGLSLDTGKQLWGPTTPAEPYLNTYTNLYMEPWGQSVIAYGKLFTAGMAGVVNAYDVTDGEHLWTYEIADPYTETMWGNWPAPIHFISDGKVYLFHQEHSGNTPLPRGAPAVCLDAETGEEIWRINGLRMGTRWGGQPIIGDSIIAGLSSYDNRIVAIGKGPSSTTVSASPKVVAKGTSVVIEGTVMDESPGTKEYALTARFPNGVPAIADEFMSEWMLYVYKQFPHPADAVGVPVTLDAVDPDGNWINIATVTSDASGLFSYMWTPPDEGPYTIIATCMGTKSYWASYAQTALGVGPAPEEPPETEDIAEAVMTEIPAYTTIDLLIIAAVAVAIVIGIVNLYAVRKR